MWEKNGKIRRTRSMTKKRSSEIFALKMDIFPEIGPRKNFLVPPNSAPGLRPWCQSKAWLKNEGDAKLGGIRKSQRNCLREENSPFS